MELHTDEGNFHALKVTIAGELNGDNVKINFTTTADTVCPFMSRKRLPVIKTADGTSLFSANAATSLIFLKAKKQGDSSKVDQWLEWESSLLLPSVHRVVLAAGGKLDDTLLTPLKSQLQVLEEGLGKDYILGTSVTAADVVIWSTIFALINASNATKAIVAEYKKVKSWFDLLLEENAFKNSVQLIFKKDIQKNLKSYISASPVPPAASARTARTLGVPLAQTQVSVEEEEEAAVTAEEKAAAYEAWLNGRSEVEEPLQISHPILPSENRKNVLVTSALPYVNNVPHLGNIIGCVLSADVYARYCRLRNYNTLYICGTDEYGTATETKAMAEGLTPLEICNKYNKLHTEIYEWFNIRFDYFGRTTTSQQTKIAQDIFWDLYKNENILKDTVEQLQCQKCSRFLADRFVEGTCPLCGYDDARGDQCDKCGKLINATELVNPKCKTCGNTPVIKSTSHLFLDLPKLEPVLQAFLEKEFEKGLWSSNSKVITRAWIRDGLKPRCISRDLKWGIPVPLEGYTDKVFYVWYDAPIGYISITANYTEEWEKWWKNPEQVSLYQFMAKDNIPFHSVIFPCTLLGTQDKWTMVNHLSATEYLNYEDTKFSKSRGVGVFGNDAKDTGIPADIWRFYLLYLRPESQDSAFSWDDFLLKNNSELLNNLGNFIQRALVFVFNNFGQCIPEIKLSEEDKELLAQVTRELQTYVKHLENIRLREGIRNIMNISRLGNQFIQASQPWVKVKGNEEEKARAGTVVGLAANMACLLSVLIKPYMPTVSETIQNQLNAPSSCNIITDKFVCFLPRGHKINKPTPLFQKIEGELFAELKKRFAGDQASRQKQGSATSEKASPEVIAKLTEEVTKQGNVVRHLKQAKAEKSVINAEVAKLLDLKKQLTAASGEPAADAGKGKKKGGQQKQQGGGKEKKPPGGGAANQTAPSAAPCPTESPEMIAALQEQVSKQGNVVREVKAAKAAKEAIDAEVAKLLDLKRILAVAMGQDPNAVLGGGKSKKGKKK